MRKWTRRAFIGAGSLVGGGFVLGAGELLFAPSRQSVVSADAAEKGQLTTWITVTPDDLVTVLVPHCEMGQGTHTALAMMAAEEMDADWNLVRVREARPSMPTPMRTCCEPSSATFPHRSCGAWTGERIAWRAGSAPRRRAAPRPFAAPGNTA